MIALQAAVFSGLCFLAVLYKWLARGGGRAEAFCALGLLCMTLAAAVPALGMASLLSSLLGSAALGFMVLGLRPGGPTWLLGSLILGAVAAHGGILLVSSAGFSPKEASGLLVHAALSISVSASLIQVDEAWPGRSRLPVFLLFALHAVFCLGVAGTHQAGVFETASVSSPSYALLLGTEQSLFCIGLTYFLLLGFRCNAEASNPRHSCIPVCAACHRVREGQDQWQGMEPWLSEHAGLGFTHGICPQCAEQLYPGIDISQPRQEEEPRSTRAPRRFVSQHPFAEIRELK